MYSPHPSPPAQWPEPFVNVRGIHRRTQPNSIMLITQSLVICRSGKDNRALAECWRKFQACVRNFSDTGSRKGVMVIRWRSWRVSTEALLFVTHHWEHDRMTGKKSVARFRWQVESHEYRSVCLPACLVTTRPHQFLESQREIWSCPMLHTIYCQAVSEME